MTMHPESIADPVTPRISDEMIANALAESGDHIAQFFAFAHLPPRLAGVSRVFAELAAAIVLTIPRNPERTVALRKLLEAKDAGVRAYLAKE